MKRGWPSQRQPPRFLDLLKKFYYFFGDSCPQHRKKKGKDCTNGWMQPIYLFESAAQNGKYSPQIMK